MSPELPFLIQWGHVVGVGLASLFALGLVGVRQLLAVRRARRAAAWRTPRADDGQLGETPGEPRYYAGVLVGEATVEGFDGEAACVSTVDLGLDERLVLSRAAAGLILQVGDELVPLQGAARCVLGGREWYPQKKVISLPDSVASPLIEAMEESGGESILERRPRFSALRAGDAVRVYGVLERRAQSDGESGYRETSAAFALAPAKDEELVLVFAGRPSFTGQSRAGQVGMAVLGFALAYGALYLQAEAIVDDGAAAFSRPPHVADPAEHPAALRLALSPHHRTRMLNRLWSEMRRVAPVDERVAERRVRVASELGCARAVGTAVEHGLFERARELTDGCPEAAQGGLAACAAGRYEELPSDWPGDAHAFHVGRYALLTQLAARHFEAARDTARDEIEQERAVRETPLDLSNPEAIVRDSIQQAGRAESREARVRKMQCVAQLADLLAGESSARSELARDAVASPFCRLLLASVTDGPERLPLLASLAELPQDSVVLVLTAEVSVAAAAERLPWLVTAPGLRPVVRPPSPLAFPRLDGALSAIAEDEAPTEGRTLALHAVLRFMEATRFVSRADPDGALTALHASETALDGARAALLPEARSETAPGELLDASEDDTRLLSLLDELEGWIAVRRALLAIEPGDLEEARSWIARSPADARDWVSARLSLREAPLEGAGFDMSTMTLRLMDAAASGDGRAVARAAGDEILLHDELLRITYAAETHRDVLATHLRYRHEASAGCEPAHALDRVVRALRLARALEDESWVEALEAQRRMHLTALDHPDVALPILLLASYADVAE